MATIIRGSGIRLELPDDAIVTDVDVASTATRGGTGPLPTGTIPLPGATGSAETGDPIVESFQTQDLELIDSFDVELPERTTRGAPGAAEELVAELAATDNAVVLLETDGVYEWRLPDPARDEAVPGTMRGALAEPPRHRVVFDLRPTPTETPGDRTRSIAGDFIRGRVRTFVLKFVAGFAVQQGVKFLERNTRRGLVVMDADDPSEWRNVEDLSAVEFPRGRAPRILLFVHGTFSSTRGSYGALGASTWGREFLAAARGAYDLVIGYDHRTLGEDPLENATDLLARLETGSYDASPVIDAVAFSRGALVLRSLIEYLFPSSRLDARVRRAVFVGGTNGGTLLARPENWSRLVDLYTNVAAAGGRAIGLLGAPLAGLILRESVGTLGALVKYMASAAVSERRAPGLAAMNPDGDFVSTINVLQPGQPTPDESTYYVVSSDFDVAAGQGAPELSTRLRQWILDTFVDSLLRAPNDLVVNTTSMSAIDESAGAFVKDTFAFGRNPHVYHTIYFTRPEVTQALSRWLLGAQRVAEVQIPAIADASVVVAHTEDGLSAVLDRAERANARYVVLERTPDMRYAFSRGELESASYMLTPAERVGGGIPVWQALDRVPGYELHETSASRTVPADTPPIELSVPPARPGTTAGRTILVDGTAAVAVVESPTMMQSTSELADLMSERGGATRTRGGESGAPETISLPPPRGGDGASASPPPSRNATFFFSASMPASVPVDKSTQLIVDISRDEIARAAGITDQTTATVNLERKLTVLLVVKSGFDVVGDDTVTIDPEAQRTFHCVFRLNATEAGTGELLVMILQGAEQVTSLVLRPEVVQALPSKVRTIRARAEAAPTGGGTFPALMITEAQEGGKPVYKFGLYLGTGEYVTGTSPPLRTERADYVADLYKKIETKWLGAKDDFAAFEAEMRAYGSILFDDLLPSNIQAALWDVRDTLSSIHVVSEEPSVPWEMVHLKAPRDANGTPAPLPPETVFLAQKGLMRWLSNRGAAARQIRVRPGHAFYVIPDYAHPKYKLREAQLEILYLTTNLAAEAAEPEQNALRRLLGDPGAVDLFHFAGHGEAVAQTQANQSTQAQIMLLGRVEGGQWRPLYLTADVVQAYAQLESADGNRPLVVLNACQGARANWQLTSMGGFAEAFLRGKAGAFVGALWNVRDQPARTFTEAFYSALLAGKAMAQATTEAREAARAAGDASWLAYVVYGHPFAMLYKEPSAAGAHLPDAAASQPASTT